MTTLRTRRASGLLIWFATAAIAWFGFPPSSPSFLPWMSGATHAGATESAFDDWRGHRSSIAGTWNDTYDAQINQWSLMPQYGLDAAWQSHVDNAIGGIYKSRGDTWEAAATGAYNDRWRDVLATAESLWGDRPGTMYIRFAHEFNGDWYDWSVTESEIEDFKDAWIQFRAIQQDVFPEAKLVFSPNSETSEQFGADWRRSFPGASYVDVIGTDYYNQFPFIASSAEFSSVALLMDEYGGPRGLERHRQFAESVGLPFALPEWSSNAGMGDSPDFVAELHRWMHRHAGQGPGNLLYEIQFSVPGYDGNFIFFPETNQPRASAKYAELWSRGS